MHTLTIIGIAVALAMDAFAVAIASGVSLGRVSRRQTFRLAWHFGLFQALMPIIGWGLGTAVNSYIANFDHWLAFGLLSFIAVRMIAEALGHGGEESRRGDPTKGGTMIMLSVATSIDAMAVGTSFAVLKISIWIPVLVIGVVAAAFTVVGLHLGSVVSRVERVGKVAEIFGGVVLILIGIRILWDHGVFT